MRARLRALCDGVLGDYARRRGKSRWADKTPDNALCLDFIDRTFEHRARYIVVARHGADVAASLEAHTASDTPSFIARSTRGYRALYADPLLAMAAYWRDVSQRLRDHMRTAEDRCLLVRYEDLVRDPAAQMRRVLTFLDEPHLDDLVDRAFSREHDGGYGDPSIADTRRVEPARAHRWRALSPDRLAPLAPLLDAELTALGYEPLSVSAS